MYRVIKLNTERPLGCELHKMSNHKVSNIQLVEMSHYLAVKTESD